MTVGGQHWDFIAPPFDGHDDGGYLAGVWSMSVTVNYTTQSSTSPYAPVQTVFDIRTLVPSTLPVVIASGNEPKTDFKPTDEVYVGLAGPAPHTPSYSPFYKYGDQFLSVLNAFHFDQNSVPTYTLVPIFWFDPQTDRFGFDLAQQKTVNGKQTYAIGGNNYHFDLYLNGTNQMLGRGIAEGNFPSQASGQLAASVSMVKLPGNAIVSP